MPTPRITVDVLFLLIEYVITGVEITSLLLDHVLDGMQHMVCHCLTVFTAHDTACLLLKEWLGPEIIHYIYILNKVHLVIVMIAALVDYCVASPSVAVANHWIVHAPPQPIWMPDPPEQRRSLTASIATN